MLSVVIPVYKTPQFALERCLNSVLSLHGDVEVICVLDSPGDSCGDVLAAFERREQRIRLLENESNRGVSFSRNRGLDMANGDVLAFVDADDEIVPMTYQQSLELMLAHNLDMCVCMSPNGGSWHGVKYGEYVESTFGNADEATLTATISALGQSCWGGLWRRDLIKRNGLRFDEQIRFNEDFLFSTQAICAGDRLGFYNLDGYHRIGCDVSVTRRPPCSLVFFNLLLVQCRLMRILSGKTLPMGVRRWYARIFIGNVFGDRHFAKYLSQKEKTEYQLLLKEFLDLFRKEGYLACCSFPARIVLKLLSSRPSLIFENYWLTSFPMGGLLKIEHVVRK